MPEPFNSAYLKLAWAREHINELEWEIADFLHVCPCESFAEPHPDKPEHTIQKIRLLRTPPERLSLIAGDAVDNLRAALDHAIYEISIPCDGPGTRSAYFPFAGSVARFEDQLKGRCADVPKDIWPLLRSFKPYEGGNRSLVALNRACNRNKHALLLSLAVLACPVQESLAGKGGPVSVPVFHVWDRSKNEMELFTIGPGAQYKAQFDFRFLVVLSEIGIAEDEQAFTVLNALAGEVQRVLGAIEAEARRLGITK